MAFGTDLLNFLAQIYSAANSSPAPAPAPVRTTQNKQQVPVQTKRQAIQETARRVAAQRATSPAGDFGTALKAGILDDPTFGLWDRAIAAGTRYLPSAITGNNTNASYSDILALQQAITQAEKDRSASGNILGTVYGDVVSGAGLGKLAGTALKAAPAAVRGTLSLERAASAGAKARNVARLSAAGGAMAAANTAGHGGSAGDVAESAAIGAAATPATLGAFRAGEWLSRPLRDALRITPVSEFLRRYTSTTAEELAAKAAQKRANGIEPTVFELLSPKDQEKVTALFPRMGAGPRQEIADQARTRIEAMGPELQTATAQLTAPQADKLSRVAALDLAQSHGAATPTPQELDLARKAVRDPLAMDELRTTQARNIMAPYDKQPVYQSIDDLIPQQPSATSTPGSITMQPSDPEVANLIRRIAPAPLRTGNRPVTGGDLTAMMSKLTTLAGNAQGTERLVIEDTRNHLASQLANDYPQMAGDIARMRDSWAARSRFEEGFAEGARSRTQQNVTAPDRSSLPQPTINAYRSPEGASGRFAGQAAALNKAFGAESGSALNTAQSIATSPNAQEALAQNLGDQAARGVTSAAESQLESLRKLQALTRGAAGDEIKPSPDTMATVVAGLNPASMTYTKLRSLATVMHLMRGIPEGRANMIVDSLLSNDPATRNAGIRLMNNAGSAGRQALRAVMLTALAAAGASDAQRSGTAAAASVPDGGSPDPSQMSDEELIRAYRAAQATQSPDPSQMSDEDLIRAYEHAVDPTDTGARIEAMAQHAIPGVTITSRGRSEAHNRAVGGVPNSEHLYEHGAKARDILPPPGMSMDELHQRLSAVYGRDFKVLNEGNHVHVEPRP